jgi:hypothetical protein
MTLAEYLKIRTLKNGRLGGIVKSLTAKEARLFGIPYPLQTGWPDMYAHRHASESDLKAARSDDRRHKPSERHTHQAIDAIARFVASVHDVGLESAHDAFAELETELDILMESKQ